ncbi:unnamed protein product, partial [Iphiclides podalirius]
MKMMMMIREAWVTHVGRGSGDVGVGEGDGVGGGQGRLLGGRKAHGHVQLLRYGLHGGGHYLRNVTLVARMARMPHWVSRTARGYGISLMTWWLGIDNTSSDPGEAPTEYTA